MRVPRAFDILERIDAFTATNGIGHPVVSNIALLREAGDEIRMLRAKLDDVYNIVSEDELGG